jgi:hypothetical protein
VRIEPRSRLFLVAGALVLCVMAAGWLVLRGDRPSHLPPPSADAPARAGVQAVTAAPRSAPVRDPSRIPGRARDARDEEHEGLLRLRQLAVSNPRQALDLGADLDRRFPGGAFAEERASLAIDALVNLGDIGQARSKSEEYFDRFRHGRFGVHVETLTGVHPHATFEDDAGT